MSKGQMVVGPDLTPDRLKKFENVLGEITRQLVQGLHSPGKGVSLEEGQIFAEHRNPFELVTSKVGESAEDRAAERSDGGFTSSRR